MSTPVRMKPDDLPMRQRTPIRHWIFNTLVACYLAPLAVLAFIALVPPWVEDLATRRRVISPAIGTFFILCFVASFVGLFSWGIFCRRDRTRAVISWVLVLLASFLLWLNLFTLLN